MRISSAGIIWPDDSEMPETSGVRRTGRAVRHIICEEAYDRSVSFRDVKTNQAEMMAVSGRQSDKTPEHSRNTPASYFDVK